MKNFVNFYIKNFPLFDNKYLLPLKVHATHAYPLTDRQKVRMVRSSSKKMLYKIFVY
jgi:hypothetical protein